MRKQSQLEAQVEFRTRSRVRDIKKNLAWGAAAQEWRNGTFWLVTPSYAEASDQSVKDEHGPRDSRVIAAVRSDWLALVCARHALAV